MDVLKALAQSLQAGEAEAVREGAAAALAQGREPSEVLQLGLITGMNAVGEEFRRREIFLPDVLLAARAMQAGMEVLRPLLARDGVPSAGRVVLGTVKGDVHDIGKNLVAILLKGACFEVVDLGVDVSAERFVAAAVEAQAKVIGMSALLTTTMPGMKDVVARLNEQGLAGRIRTIVGGAPVSERFAREIGADAYAFDASTAVERVRALIGTA